MSKIESSLAEMEAFSSMKELLRGNMGIMGWDGHSPMHVQETKPTGSDVRIGDMWYQPSSERMFLFNGNKWPEVLRDGPIGLEGEKGEKGKDSTVPGPKGDPGKDGKDGKDAEIDYKKVEKTASFPLKEHEKTYDHSLIDPFLIGTKKINESGIEDGKVLQYDKKSNKIVYGSVKNVTNVIQQGGGGTTLPSQTGNSGKYLTTNGTRTSWATASGTGDVVGPASATANNVALFDGTTGKLIKDSGLALSGTNTGDQLVFKTIAVAGQSDVVADTATDTLTLIAGSNITLTTDATNDSITITGSGGGSGITRSVNSISTPTTAGATASTDYVYLISSGTTLTLPNAVGNTNRYTVKNVDSSDATVDFTGGQTADGSATLTLRQYVAVDLISDGSNFNVI